MGFLVTLKCGVMLAMGHDAAEQIPTRSEPGSLLSLPDHVAALRSAQARLADRLAVASAENQAGAASDDASPSQSPLPSAVSSVLPAQIGDDVDKVGSHALLRLQRARENLAAGLEELRSSRVEHDAIRASIG